VSTAGDSAEGGLSPESFANRMTELQRWRLHSLPLADTTSEAAASRRRAEDIVDRAIEAMGGLDRLLAVRDMSVSVETWNSRSYVWAPGPTRYYRRGTGFREDLQRGISQGTDGRLNWRIRYGVLRPPPDLRQQAERWDFLSRFRGDGIVVDYVGTRLIRRERREVIRVLDVKYGDEYLAWFDPDSGLLVGQGEGRRHVSYLEYQKVAGVLVPRLIGSEAGIPRERWTVSIDQGLPADLFAVPPERSWEPEHMSRIVNEHVARVSEPVRVRWKAFYQAPQPMAPDTPNAILATAETTDLVEAYTRRKLESAGVLAREGPWHLEAYIDRYYQTIPPPSPPWRQVEIVVILWKEGDTQARWSDRFVRRWPVTRRPAVDDVMADAWTSEILTRLARGWPQALKLQSGADSSRSSSSSSR
jgi:hypothetical protein